MMEQQEMTREEAVKAITSYGTLLSKEIFSDMI